MPNDARRRKGDAPATRLSPGLTKLLGAIALVALGFSGLSAVGGQPTSALLASEPAATTATASERATAGSSTSAAPASQVRSARAGRLAFRSEDRLARHFAKHGRETGCGSAQDYVAAANAVVANDAALHKRQADGDDAYYVEKTGEFVVVSGKGFLRTYFVTDRDYFDRQ